MISWKLFRNRDSKIHPEGDQSLVFIGRTDVEAETPILWPCDVKSWLIWEDPDVGKDWGQEEKGTTEDEMVGWHHWHNGHGFGWTLGADDRWEVWHAAVHGVSKSWTWLSDWTELNWTELAQNLRHFTLPLLGILIQPRGTIHPFPNPRSVSSPVAISVHLLSN